MLGSRSVVMCWKEITPSTATSMMPTITVYGFFTLILDSITLPPRYNSTLKFYYNIMNRI